MVVNRYVLLLIGMCVSVFAKDTFLAFGFSNSLTTMPSEYEVFEPKGSHFAGNSDTTGSMTTLAIGQKMRVADVSSRIEPSIGYKFYTGSMFYSHVLFVELPLLYEFPLWNRKISLGPEVKYLYFAEIEIPDGNGDVNIGDKHAGSYGFKVMVENKTIDYFIFYEYLANAVININRENSQSATKAHIDMQSGYVGIGLRWKF